MALASLLIFIIVSSLVIVFGGVLLRKFLPSNHAFQKYLTDNVIENYLAWIMRNGKYVLGGLLMATFVILTFVYS
jgi:hypothetical protein